MQYGYAAEALWEDGLFLGSGSSFELDKPLTRSAGAVMIVRLLGKEAEAKEGSYSMPFTDVTDWAVLYVGYCYEKGIISGIEPTTYGSSDKMTPHNILHLSFEPWAITTRPGTSPGTKLLRKPLNWDLYANRAMCSIQQRITF